MAGDWGVKKGADLAGNYGDSFFTELREVVGELVAVGKGQVVIEARRRFEITVDEQTADSIRCSLGKEVGLLCIGGKTRWRIVKASSER